MEINEHTKYWSDSSDDDFQAMLYLFEKGDNTWSLFIGHLVLEKLLKAYYVNSNRTPPPLIHDLVRLAEKGTLILDDKQKDMLDTISTFNIRERYDDYKREFHNKYSDAFT